MMQIKRKTMRRSEWTRVVASEYAAEAFQSAECAGAAGLLHLLKVRQPLTVCMAHRPVTLADDGYWWMQIAPENQHWWLTVMFDDCDRIVQYYFDMTLRNFIRPHGDSYFDDLFLDIVLLPGSGKFLLDEDEWTQALKEGVIDEEQHAMAWRTAEHIWKNLDENAQRLEAFCVRRFWRLRQQLKSMK